MENAATPQQRYIIIDFDSTFMKVEAMDVLSEISLRNHADGAKAVEEVKHLTDLAMEGKLAFDEALKRRLALLQANRSHIPELVEKLKSLVSNSFVNNRIFFDKLASEVYIVSSGFKEFIEPIVTQYGVLPQNIYANTLKFDEQGNITGFDETNVLSQNQGKVKLLKNMNLQGDVYVIGDGYTDYEIRAAGLANRFYAFTENVTRESVVNVADHVAASLDEFLYDNKLPMTLSYPKSRINVLLLENIHPHAVDIFRNEGYNVESITTALDEDELSEKIKNVSILGIRSKTQVTAKVLENANKLIAIGAFCIGTNQIDLAGCLRKGVVAFNAPYSNTRSVVELAIGEIIVLIRNIADKSRDMHAGKWNKSAGNSFEIRNKTLGIVGYGNIGTQLSVLAENLGMKVLYYDTVDKLSLGNAQKCYTLNELLEKSDVVTLHIDGRKENTNFFGEEQFAAMKDGVIFLNLSRGHVVDIPAVVKYIKNGKINGAGFDVYPHEPKNNWEPFVSELQGLPNVLLTPHIGGSTEEAQLSIGTYVPEKIIEYVNSGNTFANVNFPAMQLPEFKIAHRIIHVHENKPGIMAQINRIFAEHNINILGQYLKTTTDIGYVITDIDKEYQPEVLEALKKIPATIKFRVLY